MGFSRSCTWEGKGSDYFEGVQTGRARAKKALDRLQELAGPSHPLLFLKMGVPDWTPVGEEELFALVSGREDQVAVVICDSDGNAKAMSAWFGREEAEKISAKLRASGLAEYSGEVKLPL